MGIVYANINRLPITSTYVLLLAKAQKYRPSEPQCRRIQLRWLQENARIMEARRSRDVSKDPSSARARSIIRPKRSIVIEYHPAIVLNKFSENFLGFYPPLKELMFEVDSPILLPYIGNSCSCFEMRPNHRARSYRRWKSTEWGFGSTRCHSLRGVTSHFKIRSQSSWLILVHMPLRLKAHPRD